MCVKGRVSSVSQVCGVSIGNIVYFRPSLNAVELGEQGVCKVVLRLDIGRPVCDVIKVSSQVSKAVVMRRQGVSAIIKEP